MHPRTPRTVSDRGRYPEEAGQEEVQREETSSDDDEEPDDQPFAFHPGGSEPVFITKPCTPANSVNGDDLSMSMLDSPGASMMDVDMVSRPFIFSVNFS